MNLSDCKNLGNILAHAGIDPGVISRILSLDPRIEKYFDLWCEILEEEERVKTATHNRMVDKYGYGWEVNKEILPHHYREVLNKVGQDLLGDDYDPDDYMDININNLRGG